MGFIYRDVRIRAPGIEVARMPHDDVDSVALSPDGKYVATGSEDNVVRVWLWCPEDLIEHAKEKTGERQTNVRVGNISDISGNVNVAGGNITTHQTTTGLSAAEIKQLLDQPYTAIESRANTISADKEDLKAEVKEIQSTVTEAAKKNAKVDEGFLSRRGHCAHGA